MENQVKLTAARRMRRQCVRLRETVATKGKQNMIIVLALVALIVVFYILNPNFLKTYNIVSMAQSLAPYAVLALGVTFVIATGGIDLSIGTVCIASSVIAGHMFERNLIPLWAVIPLMIAMGALFGLVNGILVAKLKVPAFIATLGTMMLTRGLSALIVKDPNIFFPTGTWFNNVFSAAGKVPTGLFWVLGFMLLCMYLMYKNRIGRYILSIGSNEEATRLSGINTDKYKIIAYVFSGCAAGIAAIFWSAAFPTVAAATGNGMELDAIAGVYIGGTSAAGGVASIAGSVIGNMMLVVIRSGLNFVLAKFNLNMNSTYVTYVLTGIIVVAAVLMDTIKNKNAMKVKEDTPKQKVRKHYVERKAALNDGIDAILVDGTITEQERTSRVAVLNDELTKLKADYLSEMEKLKSQSAKA